ncbi:hypothetical protein IQ60_32070 [Streptomyces europaeiscabiei]|nr:hypothetical protein IQ60_32070 [Streptomyces europaeiscabiei]
MAGDPAEDVYLDPGVGEPGECGVPEVVAAQMLVAELGDHGAPMCGVAQDGGGDTSASGAREQAGVRMGPGEDALGDEGRISSTTGTLRSRLPLVLLSVSPPGAGVV